MAVALLGDTCAGKSCLTAALLGQSANRIYEPTVSAVHHDSINVWEFPGAERFMTIKAPRAHDFHSCILAYDVSDMSSFDHLRWWFDEFVGFGTFVQNPQIIVVGCKADRKSHVSLREAELWAASLSTHPGVPAIHLTCSALKGDGIMELKRVLAATSVPSTLSAVAWNSGGFELPECRIRAHVTIEHPSVNLECCRCALWNTTGATVELSTTPIETGALLVGADCAVLVARLRFASMVAAQIVEWSDAIRRHVTYQCDESMTLFFVGVPSTDFTQDTEVAAKYACSQQNVTYIRSSGDALWWAIVADVIASRRRDIIVDRSSIASTCQPDPSEPISVDELGLETTPTSLPQLNEATSQSVLVLALHRQVLDSSMNCERRIEEMRSELRASQAAHEKERQTLVEANRQLANELADLRLEVRAMWREIERKP